MYMLACTKPKSVKSIDGFYNIVSLPFVLPHSCSRSPYTFPHPCCRRYEGRRRGVSGGEGNSYGEG